MAVRNQDSNWVPRTELGKQVMSKQVTNIDEILSSGKRILETEIIDELLPDLKEEVLEIKSTQRMTAYGRKQQMRAVIILGNRRGYIAVGVGKAAEVRDAIGEAITEAKKNIIRINLGCGSWECGCGTEHSLAQKVSGKSSSTEVTIAPAPKGIGVVAGENTKKVLELAGVSDCWTFSKGRTRNILNAILATLKALSSANRLKRGKYFEEQIEKIEQEIKEDEKVEKNDEEIVKEGLQIEDNKEDASKEGKEKEKGVGKKGKTDKENEKKKIEPDEEKDTGEKEVEKIKNETDLEKGIGEGIGKGEGEKPKDRGANVERAAKMEGEKTEEDKTGENK